MMNNRGERNGDCKNERVNGGMVVCVVVVLNPAALSLFSNPAPAFSWP